MSGEVNMIPTLRKFKGGPVQAYLGGASLETFSGGGQLKKSPCIRVFRFCSWFQFSDKMSQRSLTESVFVFCEHFVFVFTLLVLR